MQNEPSFSSNKHEALQVPPHWICIIVKAACRGSRLCGHANQYLLLFIKLCETFGALAAVPDVKQFQSAMMSFQCLGLGHAF